ncbi:MAG: galactokinase [Candidatus Hydrogenedentota bacterium]
MSVDIEQAKKDFEQRFGRPAQVAGRAPGRVNIIGEHTDYNHGFVLPMAIDRDTLVLSAVRDDSILSVFAADLDQRAEINLKRLARSEDHPWLDYISGVALMLQETGRSLSGADILVVGDVPLGCGLSSSASLEMAVLCLFEATGDFTLPDRVAAQLCQRVENYYLGLSSGIMDPFISRAGKLGHALFVDCRTLEHQPIPANLGKALFVIADTGVRRELTASKYNERVAECQHAVAGLNGALNTSGTHLRDFTLVELDEAKDTLGDVEFRRARHVISENERTSKACGALRDGNLVELGELMNASDVSLVADYEVSCNELRIMTDIARSLEGCYGARMTGAGFGGCTINLVARECVDAFCVLLREAYDEQSGIESEIIVSSAATGACSTTL